MIRVLTTRTRTDEKIRKFIVFCACFCECFVVNDLLIFFEEGIKGRGCRVLVVVGWFLTNTRDYRKTFRVLTVITHVLQG